MSEVNHWRRVVLWWVAATVVATPLVVFVAAPGLPPGNGTGQASGQGGDYTGLLGVSTPGAPGVPVPICSRNAAGRVRGGAGTAARQRHGAGIRSGGRQHGAARRLHARSAGGAP